MTGHAKAGFHSLTHAELLHISRFLSPQPNTTSTTHLPPQARPSPPPPADLVALASTSTRLRALLLPQVFHTLVLGEKERSKKCKKRLRELSKMRDVLLSVRHVVMLDIMPSAIKPLVSCFEKMLNLHYYTHSATSPVLIAVAHILRSRTPSFRGLFLTSFAADSLPSFASPALPGQTPQLRHLSINTQVEHPLHRDILHHAPLTVAPKRRIGWFGKIVSAPTVEEHTLGLVAGLARLLLVSKETLESVEIERGGSLTDVRLLERVWEHMLQLGGGVRPVFPKLEWVSLRKLDCDGEGLQHILATSPRISHLCLVERLGKAVEPPAEPLVALESLHYLFVMDLSVSSTVHAFLSGTSHLTELELQGLHVRELKHLFPHSHSSSAYHTHTIRSLNLAMAGGALGRKDLVGLCAACPGVVELKLTALTWRATWGQLVDVLSTYLTQLESIELDHPVCPPRVVHPRTNGEVGDGIVSNGGTRGESMLSLLHADKPLITHRLAELGTACTRLSQVVLYVTTGNRGEVKWVWRIGRVEDGAVVVEEVGVGEC